jgi:archaellum component FlaC
MIAEIKTSDMLRTTADNLSKLLQQMADHIDHLETRVKELEEALNATK